MTVDDHLQTSPAGDPTRPIEPKKTPTVELGDVKAVLVTTLGIQARAETLDATTELLGSLPELDSLAVLELLAALEQRFGIRIEDEDVSGEVFETLGALTAFVAGKLVHSRGVAP
jgi:acyl carrier protein